MDRVNGWLRRIPIWPLYAIGFIPAVRYFWLAVNNEFGPDPVRALERGYGLLALQLLIAALLVTPLRAIIGVNFLRFRRMLGLMAFYYAALHLLVWLALDSQFDGAKIFADLTKRPYVIIGMAAFVMLVPLAATSNNWAVRRLGGLRWRRLHRLAYPATALGAIHFIWLVKAWPYEPILYGIGIMVLLLWRFFRGLGVWGRVWAGGW